MIRTSSFNRLDWKPESQAPFMYVCSKTVWWLTLLNQPSSLGSRLASFQVSLLDKLLWTVVLKILDGMLSEAGYVLPPRKCITFLKYEIVFMHPRCNSSTRTRGMWNTLSPRKKLSGGWTFFWYTYQKTFPEKKYEKCQRWNDSFCDEATQAWMLSVIQTLFKFFNAASFEFSILLLSGKERFVQKHVYLQKQKSKLLCTFRLFRNLSRLTVWLKINPLPQSSAYSSLCKCTCSTFRVREQSSRHSCYFYLVL